MSSAHVTALGNAVTGVSASAPLASSGGAAPTISLQSQSVNQVLAGPTTGSAAAPAFRALVASDIPSLDATKIGTGTLPVARGGTRVSAFPAFSVHKNGVHQTVPPLTFTVMTWSTEVLDQTGAFSSHRFQPTVAGIYLITATLLWQAPTDQQRCLIYIAKNGVGTHAASIAASGTGTP